MDCSTLAAISPCLVRNTVRTSYRGYPIADFAETNIFQFLERLDVSINKLGEIDILRAKQEALIFS